jgi:Tol biopolymer transport system component
VSIIENDSSKFECFPAWAPDGKTLYYVAANVEYPANASREAYIMHNYEDVHYNLYKKSFNPQTEQWGDAECIYDAASEEKSITLPRVSPDGRYLMFTMGNFGVFHIWHKDANLFIMDLKNREIRELTEINSNEVESYHSWSSNGKWIVFSTRREDGGFTRLYLSHFNEDGTFSKPFALPQLNAAHNSSFMYSYNIPEFTTESVKITPKEFASFFKSSETIQAKFKPTKN